MDTSSSQIELLLFYIPLWSFQDKMVLPKDIDAYLTRRFYNHRTPGSFTSASKLYSVIKSEGRYNISRARIEDWAQSQDIVTLHKAAREKPTKYRRVIAPGMNHMWDCDLLVMIGDRFKVANEGYAYILVTTDVFSRYCRANAVKSKGGKDMKTCMIEIFEDAGAQGIPKFIRSDHGTEFTNATVHDLLDGKGIKHIFTNTETKANYAEAMIKGLKKRLFQYFQYTNSYSYKDELQKMVESYNSTIHSSIGMSPSHITHANEQDVWDYQYVTQQKGSDLLRAFKKAISTSSRGRRSNPYKYGIGQSVRVSYHRKKNFFRSYDEQFTGEVFTVRSRKVSDGVAIYYLSDYHGEKVDGPFYGNELTPVKFDPDAFFKIEKVIRTRLSATGVQESLVKYQSWPSKYNQWIPTSTIKTLNKTLNKTLKKGK